MQSITHNWENSVAGLYFHRPVSSVDKSIGAGGLGFDPRGEIGHSVANGSPPLRRSFGAVLARRYAVHMDPASRYTLRRNAASIMKI